MKTSFELKQLVKEKYSEVALQSKETNQNSCCGSCGCSTVDAAVFAENYSSLEGYVAEADLGLGCGLPTEHARIKHGNTVIDLGSGAGNDCFVASALVGSTGKVIGVDMTEAMIKKARINADKLRLNNVEFWLGEIENLPIDENIADVVVSNCVLNLVPDKKKAFAETYRVLKPGGHFSISDVVITGNLPQGLQEAAEMYAGCVSGAIDKDAYLAIVQETGFVNIELQKEKRITLPDDILLAYLSTEELETFKQSETGIYSITVYAEKPTCCEKGSGCC